MDKIIWTLLAFIAGAVLPIQGGLNTRLGKAAASPVHAAMISFVVGGLALILYILISRQTVSLTGIKEAPAYLWLGGLLGAFYVTITIMIFPKLGPGLTFGLLVAGQMIVSVILEHYNILVAQQNPISAMKMIGIALIIAGVVILEKY